MKEIVSNNQKIVIRKAKKATFHLQQKPKVKGGFFIHLSYSHTYTLIHNSH